MELLIIRHGQSGSGPFKMPRRQSGFSIDRNGQETSRLISRVVG